MSSRRIGQIERGKGAGAPLDLWSAIGAALDVPLTVDLGRDRLEDTADAGHLRVQELLLRLGRSTGRQRTFELPTRPADPSLSIDVCQRDDSLRALIINECWNTFGNVNGSVRTTRRKLAEAEALAISLGGAPNRTASPAAGSCATRDATGS